MVPRPRRAYTIAINDLDEFDITPITDSDATADAVDENAAIGTAVGITALASDGDATTNGITYSLDDDAGGQFAIDPTTGVVTVAGAIDREAGATRSITIRATSDDGSTTTQSYTIAINDLDEFDITPISDSDATADAVDENAAVGTAVGITALASDGDATTNGITYSLDDDAGGQFAIDPATGMVTVAGAIDREAGATRSITIRATSNDGSTITQSYTIAINDLDEFDITPISDSDVAADAVDENAAFGTAVGITALASDGDATTNGITYSLDDDAGGQFAIDPATGVVTVAGAIDREAGATRSITVRATSDDGSTITQSYTIAINDLDEFDITPITDSDAAVDAVDENAAVGTAVGHHGPGQRRRRDDQRHHVLAGRRRGRTIRHRSDDRRGDRGRGHRPRSGSHSVDHDPRHQRRRFHDDAELYDRHQRPGRIRHHTHQRQRRDGRCGRRERGGGHGGGHHGVGQRRRCDDQRRSRTRWTTTRADSSPSIRRPAW